MTTTTPLHNDPRGQAHAIDVEARGMDPLQLIREFIHNGGQAGAANIWLDMYVDPETFHRLLRITDDGHGMTGAQMRRHLTTLYSTSRGYETNFGIGARVAALPTNHAGVDFASRTSEGEAMMRLHRDRGVYGVANFETSDGEIHDLVEPDAGMLDRLPTRARTGTAVVLRGDGRSDTYTVERAHEIIRYLNEHYFAIPGAPTVRVDLPNSTEPRGAAPRKIQPLGERLAMAAEATGRIPFGLGRLTGTFRWWVLPADERDRRTGNIYPIPSGVGLLHADEVFGLSRTWAAEFGILYRAVQQRVLILVDVDGAEMETGRSSLILPGSGKSVPWKRLGAAFMESMPPEIEALLSQATISSTVFDAEMARLLDDEWMSKLQPTRAIVPAPSGDATIGDAGVDAPELVEGEHEHDEPNPEPRPVNPDRTPRRRAAGTNPAHERDAVKPPTVVFVDPADEGPGLDVGFVVYVDNANLVKVWRDAPAYQRDVNRWTTSTGRPQHFVSSAVEFAYGIELAAHIVDANGQSRWGIEPAMIDDMKAPAALYGKLLGVQALERNIEAHLRSLTRIEA